MDKISKKKTIILMSTYNGEKYLKSQLESLLSQKNVSIQIFIRDDGSKDNTCKILKNFQNKHKIINVEYGNNIGAKASFFDLIKKAPKGDFYAFCDQDDIWLENKLKNALEKLKNYNEIPSMYYCNPELVNENLQKISLKMNLGKPYSLGQILIKNHVPGCTMVFNYALFKLIKNIPDNKVLYLPFHDHWIYILCRLFEGNVIADNNKLILYRQHNFNVVGSRNNKFKILLTGGGLHDNNRTRYNRALLLSGLYYDELPEHSKYILHLITSYRQNFKNKLSLVFNKEIKPVKVSEKILLIFLILIEKF